MNWAMVGALAGVIGLVGGFCVWEVNKITDPLNQLLAKHENRLDDHEHRLDDHESRIVRVETKVEKQ